VTARRGEAGGAALSAEEFDRLLSRLGPFEPSPHLAVGVSGGPDSMALAFLAQAWARARGGRVTLLTVDHGLRAEAAAEARWVKREWAARSIAQVTLKWRPKEAGPNLQARAREARYGLLEGWCRRHGVLHLLLAHHREDQAETLLLRLGRGSGLEGLAAMAPLVERPFCRWLRPLLGVSRQRLQATLLEAGLGWRDDPSNQDPFFARVRMRALMPALAAEGLTAERLAATAARLGLARRALEHDLATLLAAAVKLDPLGFAWLDPASLRDAPRALQQRALAQLLTTLGGADYAPRSESLERLAGTLVAGLRAGRTLGGCRLLPRGRQLLVSREPNAAERRSLEAGQSLLWDGRFEVVLRRGQRPPGLRIAPLGRVEWRRARDRRSERPREPLPAPAAHGLPALYDATGLLEVPLLGYRRRESEEPWVRLCRFAPRRALSDGGFTVV
jgi:tRNA(Ile)-lysidine synthase